MKRFSVSVTCSDSEDDTGFAPESLGTFEDRATARAMAQWHLAESFASKAKLVWRKRGGKWTASFGDGEVTYTIEEKS